MVVEIYHRITCKIVFETVTDRVYLCKAGGPKLDFPYLVLNKKDIFEKTYKVYFELISMS